MKRTILSLTLAIVALYGFAACGNKENKTEKTDANTEATAQANNATTDVDEENAENLTGKAPDFTLDDINGNPLSLSSLKGKYVVLDFWGSWCPWCIKGIPKMKEYYQKYSGKFEIIGIDCNETQEKWKAAVATYDMPWKHVFNPRSSRLVADYGIQGYPTKIIIDPKGRVDRVVVGEDPAFYSYLDELFK